MASNNIPTAGPAMFDIEPIVCPHPETFVKCSSGAISGMDACMAGIWNALANERMINTSITNRILGSKNH